MIISKSNFSSVVIFCFIVLSSFIFVGCTDNKKKDEIEQKPLKIAVVDVEKVIKKHSDWDKLDRIEKKISEISDEMRKGSGDSLNKLGASQAKKMEEAQKKARAELEAELKQVQASLDAQKRKMEAQFESDLAAAKNAAKNMSRNAPTPSTTAVNLTGDMLVLRDRQISAKRLALQKQAKENIDREKTRLDNELLAYEQQISKENQSQRLNIQLKLQLDVAEEEKKALQDELMAINEEEFKLKEVKKQEIASQLEAISSREFKAVDDGVAAYKKQLDSDIRKQVGYGSPSKEEASQLQAKANEIQRNLAQKQKDMEAKMASAGAEANRRLNQKKAQIEKRLENLGASLNKEMKESRDAIIKSDMEKLERLRSDYASLMSEKNNLRDVMLEDIKVAVKKVLEEEKIDVVFLSYIANISAEDITDKTISELKKE